ncbi:MAG: Arginine-tRNA ligase [Parcubacteria group bacterium GW2011_GWA2_51_10]|nr:MAG: Arginine-tRNA ligase [Parcubacteria group bacterium GW2011_GWA2_51_10]
MREILERSLADALNKIGLEPGQAVIEYPADLARGDYATNAALTHAKDAGAPPRELAEKIVGALGEISGVERIEIAGPGFINFYLSPQFFAATIKEANANAEQWGRSSLLAGRRILVEYTDPNPFKEFHIGHLMSNAIGESVSRLLEGSGAVLKRANYQGDVGPHVAKAIWQLVKDNVQKIDLPALSLAYAKGNAAYEEDPQAKGEIDELNKKIYEKSDAAIQKIYEEGRRVSLEHFERLYEMLGTKFDFYFFESETGPRGTEIVRENPEIFEKSDGATIFRGEKVGLHTRVFITGSGLPTYEAKDIGLAVMKAEAWPFDISITVTGNEQKEYFAVVLAAMKELMPDIARKIEHLTHGMMRLPEGKMSSRTGKIITGESLLEELVERARERAKESRAANPDELARDIAVAAIKYQVLKQASGRNIIFEKERALSLEGDSGPYLQYAHARASAILEKAVEAGVAPKIDEKAALNEVARLLIRFPDAVAAASDAREPHFLTNFLLQFASSFNHWYAAEQILDGSTSSPHKVALTAAVRSTLKNGLWLLGIPAPEKM